jgi:hypothetical protein
VRDPIERVVSSYYHRLREPDWRHPVCRELHEKKLSLLEFAHLDLVRNEMARFFGSKRPRDFAFVGQTEKFDRSMAHFLAAFRFGSVPIPKENCNPARQSERYDLDPSTRRKLCELNELDLAIYGEACALGFG